MDAAIVVDKNLNKVYTTKIKKYEELLEILRDTKGINQRLVIPIIISVNGLIHKQTTQILNKNFQTKIDWRTVARNIVVQNMKDIMFYNGVNIDTE